MHYLIYKVTNKIDGKFYIGAHKTENINDDYMGSGVYLKNAIDKHGLDNFEKEILFELDNEDKMFAKEAEIVNEDFIAKQNTYNLKVGGFGGWDYVSKTRLPYTSETREKAAKTMSDTIRKKKENGTYVNGFKGKTHSDETKQILRQAALNRESHPRGMLNKKHTEETKAKQSDWSKKNSIFNKKGADHPAAGLIWWTNGTENKRSKIKPGDEWYKGRIMKKRK